MPLPLPNLDDRNWSDLVEEARSLIPFYAPAWTDHNEHDPGVTLLELFAWLAEMDVYQLNRIPEKHRRKFLALVGLFPDPPQAARTVLSLYPSCKKEFVELSAFLEFQGTNPFGEKITFQTLSRAAILSAELRSVQLFDGAGFQKIKKENGTWPPFAVFGRAPKPGAMFYLGFSKDLSKGGAANLYFKISGSRRDDLERQRIIAEIKARSLRYVNQPLNECGIAVEYLAPANKSDADAENSLKHHSAQTVWEFLADSGDEPKWEAISEQRKELFDNTRAFTLDGGVSLRISKKMKSARIGKANEALFYVRCRFSNGDFDAVPIVQTVVMNAIAAIQRSSVGRWELHIAPHAQVVGTIPHGGELTRVRLAFDEYGAVQQLSFEPEAIDLPQVLVLSFQPPDSQNQIAGAISLELEVLGVGKKRPFQIYYTGSKPIIYKDFRLFSLERGESLQSGVWNFDWQEWQIRSDFDASGRMDRHFTLDPTAGKIGFGNGEQGRVPPKNSWIIARYHTTTGDDGNLTAGRINRVSGSLHNHALLGNNPIFQINKEYIEKLQRDNIPLNIRKRIENLAKEYSTEEEFLNDLNKVIDHEQLDQYSWSILKHAHLLFKSVFNPMPALGGAPAESLTHAQGRAIQLADQTDRAVTVADIERLARQTPGVELSRVAVRPNLWHSLSCLKAHDNITVIVMPCLPPNKPAPSCGLLRMVKSYLDRHRPIGVRFHVVGPAFRSVVIEAKVKAFQDRDKAVLETDIINVLNTFIDPLRGGPDANGWPFGRSVFRSEVLQIIDQVDGVDYVESLSLIVDDSEPQCGNISLCPDELIVMGTHTIEVA